MLQIFMTPFPLNPRDTIQLGPEISLFSGTQEHTCRYQCKIGAYLTWSRTVQGLQSTLPPLKKVLRGRNTDVLPELTTLICYSIHVMHTGGFTTGPGSVLVIAKSGKLPDLMEIHFSW